MSPFDRDRATQSVVAVAVVVVLVAAIVGLRSNLKTGSLDVLILLLAAGLLGGLLEVAGVWMFGIRHRAMPAVIAIVAGVLVLIAAMPIALNPFGAQLPWSDNLPQRLEYSGRTYQRPIPRPSGLPAPPNAALEPPGIVGTQPQSQHLFYGTVPCAAPLAEGSNARQVGTVSRLWKSGLPVLAIGEPGPPGLLEVEAPSGCAVTYSEQGGG